MDVSTAVIPAAGFGTRFLPVTKAQPKEMMPVLDQPTIQYVVEEAVNAGIQDILIITGRGKQSIERHFDKSYELEQELQESGKSELLERVREISNLADIHYIRQQERNGLGDAVLYAQDHVGNEPFALLLGDTIIKSRISCTGTEKLVSYAEEYESSVISLERVPREKVPSYGIAELPDDDSSDASCFPVTDLIEKPACEDAPSNLAISGRYILEPEIFDQLENTKPGVDGEIQLTDALRRLSSIRGVELEGDRFDIGNIPDWLRANIEMALQHDDGEMNNAVKNMIREYIDE